MQYQRIDALSAPARPSTLRFPGEENLMINAATGICDALQDLMRSHNYLVQAMARRLEMMQELSRGCPQPSPEHDQVTHEVNFLDSLLAQARRDAGAVADKIEKLKESL